MNVAQIVYTTRERSWSYTLLLTMWLIEHFKLQYIKLAEILRNALIEYHATSSGLEMDLNGVSESN